MDALPAWSRVLTQLGFAGLVGILFYFDNMARLEEARQDRETWKQELRFQREEMRAAIAEMRSAVAAMQKCTPNK